MRPGGESEDDEAGRCSYRFLVHALVDVRVRGRRVAPGRRTSRHSPEGCDHPARLSATGARRCAKAGGTLLPPLPFCLTGVGAVLERIPAFGITARCSRPWPGWTRGCRTSQSSHPWRLAAVARRLRGALARRLRSSVALVRRALGEAHHVGRPSLRLAISAAAGVALLRSAVRGLSSHGREAVHLGRATEAAPVPFFSLSAMSTSYGPAVRLPRVGLGPIAWEFPASRCPACPAAVDPTPSRPHRP